MPKENLVQEAATASDLTFYVAPGTAHIVAVIAKSLETDFKIVGNYGLEEYIYNKGIRVLAMNAELALAAVEHYIVMEAKEKELVRV